VSERERSLKGAVHAVLLSLWPYSYLRATAGSTRIARRAGIRQANRDTAIRTLEVTTWVAGSVDDTEKS
jgi:hypothetical protein